MNIVVIFEIVEYFKKEIGYEILFMMFFVGENFNVIRVGIYVDGFMKDEEIYNIFDIGKILGRFFKVIIDVYLGIVGIVIWINRYFKDNGIDI